MTDSTTVVEFEPALAAVTIEALAAELRLTRDMLAEANDEIDRLNTALAENETLSKKLASAEKDTAYLEKRFAAQVKYTTALAARLAAGERPETGGGQ